MNEKLAYNAMLAFLDARYQRLPSDELGSLLGDLSLLNDGQPADPAVITEWNEAVQKSKQEASSRSVTILQRAS